jgi:hypothetical protein
MLKLPVLAPPPTALVTLLKVPRPVGRLSANVALVAVLGPALLSTSVYVSVPPALGVAVLATLLRLRSATRPTVMVAVPVLFPGVVSVVPGGVLTVATLAIVPLAVPETLAWKLTVMAPPEWKGHRAVDRAAGDVEAARAGPAPHCAGDVAQGAQARGQVVCKCRVGRRAGARVAQHQRVRQCASRVGRRRAGHFAQAQVSHQAYRDGGCARVVPRRGVCRARRRADRGHVGYRAAGCARDAGLEAHRDGAARVEGSPCR